jgi:hypothetical protein
MRALEGLVSRQALLRIGSTAQASRLARRRSPRSSEQAHERGDAMSRSARRCGASGEAELDVITPLRSL